MALRTDDCLYPLILAASSLVSFSLTLTPNPPVLAIGGNVPSGLTGRATIF